jgi:hypothetical protein
MSVLDAYGLGALAAIALVFYFVRRIPAYVGLCVAAVVAFAASTFRLVAWDEPSEWIIMTVGLLFSVFGLLIVRVMLIRSVSLRMLGRIDAGTNESMGEDIGGRLGDMRAFRLIRTNGELNELTGFGRFVAGVVAVFYSLFRIDA